MGGILNKINKRKSNVDLTGLKVFVLDEADSFFLVDDRKKELKDFDKILQNINKKIQYVFFSATYDEAVSNEISDIVTEAY